MDNEPHPIGGAANTAFHLVVDTMFHVSVRTEMDRGGFTRGARSLAIVTVSPLLKLSTMDTDRARVEAALLDAVKTPDAYLTEIASHLISAGGKRLRPVMTIAASLVGRDGQTVSDDVIQGGIAVELVHLGSLYHDDVMDESETRRGVETVNARWGNLQAILAGDFLLARASEIAASLGVEVAGLLARTIGRLCEGQIEELRHTYNMARPIDSYFSSIDGKTASLYSTAARIGGIVSGHDRTTIDILTDYGTHYGMVFQIVDDILDVISTDEQLGKPAGHDAEEGVYTLPLLHTLAAGGAAAAELTAILGKPLDAAERAKVLDIVRSNDGVSKAIDTAKTFVARAEESCAALPKSAATDALRDAAASLLSTVA